MLDNPVRLLEPEEAFSFTDGGQFATRLDEPLCFDGNEDTECKISDGLLVLDYKTNINVHKVEIIYQKNCCGEEKNIIVFESCCGDETSIIIFEDVKNERFFELLLARRVLKNGTERNKLFETYPNPSKKGHTWSTNLGRVGN